MTLNKLLKILGILILIGFVIDMFVFTELFTISLKDEGGVNPFRALAWLFSSSIIIIFIGVNVMSYLRDIYDNYQLLFRYPLTDVWYILTKSKGYCITGRSTTNKCNVKCQECIALEKELFKNKP